MKQNKGDIIEAVLVVATRLNIRDAYEAIIEGKDLPSLVKDIAYHMFVKDLNSYSEKADEVYEAIQLLRNYCVELGNKGFVEFGK